MATSDTDRKTLDSGVAHGCRFRVEQVRGQHFCGYIQTNFTPPWTYDDLRGGFSSLIDCHGGLTYGPDEDGYVGFDCAHAGDVCIIDGEVQTNHAMSTKMEWTPDDVAAECRKVARQVEVLQEFSEKFQRRGWGDD